MLSTFIHLAAIYSPRPTLRKDLSWRLERKRQRTPAVDFFFPPVLNGYHLFYHPGSGHLVDNMIKRIANSSY
jgi:hypothetical protein